MGGSGRDSGCAELADLVGRNHKVIHKQTLMNETEFLLFQKMAELLRSYEARIRQLEEQITGCPTDLSKQIEEMNQLLRKLPGVHFSDPNCDREDEVLNLAIDRQFFLQQRGKPDPVPFPEDDYF